MPYPSPIRILMHAGTPAERILVDWDQMIGALPSSGLAQTVEVEQLVGEEFAAIGALGNGQRSLRVEMEALMDDAAAAAVLALDSEAAVEPRVQGIRIELANPMLGPGSDPAIRCLVRWDCPDACVAGGSSAVDGAMVRRALDLTIGNATAAIPEYPPPVVPELLRTSALREDGAGRVEHSGQSWLRIRCIMPDSFTGNPVDGWTDGERLITLEWSEDLATWATGQMQAAPVADVVADGLRTAWAESIHPQDAEELTSDQVIRWQRVNGMNLVSWQLDQEITGIYVSGGNISLPHFPYAMPGDEALLQADLRAAGYAGAEVEYNGAGEWWEVRLFDVETTNYQHPPHLSCSPGYVVLDMFGDPQTIGGVGGTYHNPRFGPGLDPFVIYQKQFVRGRISRV